MRGKPVGETAINAEPTPTSGPRQTSPFKATAGRALAVIGGVGGAIIIAGFLALPMWYQALSPIRQFHVYWPLVITMFSVGVFTALAARVSLLLLPPFDSFRALAKLLIPLAIIAMLVTVPTYNTIVFAYPAQQTRSAVSRARTDMRTLSVAIEAYFADNRSYPAWTLDHASQPPFKANVRIPTFQIAPDTLRTLTTPVAHIRSLPTDSFGLPVPSTREQSSYAYWSAGQTWLLVSPGPDRVFDLDLPTIRKTYDPVARKWSTGLTAKTYDPSNGTISAGDIVRTP